MQYTKTKTHDKNTKYLPNLYFELEFINQIIAGCDEAGRGTLAGPVVAAIVILDQSKDLSGINDSKKLSADAREKMYFNIIESHQYAVASADVTEIEEINILQASLLAMQRAFNNLTKTAKVILVDGNYAPYFGDAVSAYPIIKGDSKSLSIAAASIVAKVTRDNIMKNLAKEYSQYSWHKNYGYGTREHIEAINKYGINEHHRKSFLKNILKE